MDQHPQYLMWMKNKYMVSSRFQTPMLSSFNTNSWEEQAFVDDMAFVWPPRSYSCSFCKRKFRSAQALGGHMNVHRRDRARLKQSPTSQIEDNLSQPNFDTNPNPNPNSSPSFLSLSRSPSIVVDLEPVTEKIAREEDLSMGLSLMVSQNRSCGLEFNEGIINSKRQKTNNVLSVPYFLNERIVPGLDLELRLGDAPKLK